MASKPLADIIKEHVLSLVFTAHANGYGRFEPWSLNMQPEQSPMPPETTIDVQLVDGTSYKVEFAIRVTRTDDRVGQA